MLGSAVGLQTGGRDKNNMAEIIPLGAISMTSDEPLVVELRSSEKSSTLYFSCCSVVENVCFITSLLPYFFQIKFF